MGRTVFRKVCQVLTDGKTQQVSLSRTVLIVSSGDIIIWMKE